MSRDGKSILDGIRVASPCPASWDEMVGDDRIRFCSGCRKDVYNISAMTTNEALALVVDRESTPCVQFYRRVDGSVLTADCPVGGARVRRRRLRRLAGLAAVGLGLMATGASAFGVRRRPIEPFPTGPGVTVDDWIDWGLVATGLRQRIAATAGSPMPIWTPLPGGCPASPPVSVRGELDAILVKGEPEAMPANPLPLLGKVVKPPAPPALVQP